MLRGRDRFGRGSRRFVEGLADLGQLAARIGGQERRGPAEHRLANRARVASCRTDRDLSSARTLKAGTKARAPPRSGDGPSAGIFGGQGKLPHFAGSGVRSASIGPDKLGISRANDGRPLAFEALPEAKPQLGRR